MKNVRAWMGTLLAIGLLGCGGEPEPSEPQPQQTYGAEREANLPERETAELPMPPEPLETQPTERAATCPILAPSTDVTAQDIEGGAALVFTTNDPSELPMLRTRARELAQYVERMDAIPQGPVGMGAELEGGPSAEIGREVAIPASTVNVVDVENGARLDVLARQSADIASLRALARAQAEQMRAGECPMMQAAVPRTTVEEPG
jgi:hypothetical protein